jgi:hypothetical protein
MAPKAPSSTATAGSAASQLEQLAELRGSLEKQFEATHKRARSSLASHVKSARRSQRHSLRARRVRDG